MDEHWHREASVQAVLASHLRVAGWTIAREANTATKEPGIDVGAERNGQSIGFEVKGYPSRSYADPARAAESKPTRPSTQASHWFSQAVLAAMRLRTRHPAWRSAIALPDFPRYRRLYAETSGSLDEAAIEVWWVSPAGRVTEP